MSKKLNKDKKWRINLDEPAPLPKEQLWNSTKTFYGKASEILEKSRKHELQQDQDRIFRQNAMCPNFTSVLRLMTIRDGITISHAPVGCAGYLNAQPQLFQGIPKELGRPELDFHWLTSNLRENDVIFGGSEKLGKTIKLADERYKPKSIFVLASCVSGIIGDDLEGLVREIQPDTKATIVPIHCEGTRSRIWQSGYDSVWHGVLKYLVREPKKTQEDLVNIPASFSLTWIDRQELTRLLAKLGLRPNFVPELATTEQLEILAEAAVTAPVCGSLGNYLGYGLEQEFDVPFFNYPPPFGLHNTESWLRKIAEFTGKENEVEKLIEEERAAIEPRLEALRKEFKGDEATVLDWGGQARGLGLPLLTHELGLDVKGIGMYEYDEVIPEAVEELIEKVGDFDVVVADMQPYELEQIFIKHKPDVYTTCPFTGGHFKRAHTAGVRHHSFRGDPTPNSPQYGYVGLITYGNFLLRAHKHHTLNKTLGTHVRQPYKEKIYRQHSPFVKKEEKGKITSLAKEEGK